MPAPRIRLDYTGCQTFKLKRGKNSPLFLAHLAPRDRKGSVVKHVGAEGESRDGGSRAGE